MAQPTAAEYFTLEFPKPFSVAPWQLLRVRWWDLFHAGPAIFSSSVCRGKLIKIRHRLFAFGYPFGIANRFTLTFYIYYIKIFYKNQLVGVAGFEPAASWSQTKRSTKLSYTPKN